MLSFTLHNHTSPRPEPNHRQKVLVTGAGGNIGSYFAKHAAEKFDLRLFVHKLTDKTRALKAYGEIVAGDLTDPKTARAACEDVDAVLHLAGAPNAESTWDTLLPLNVVLTYNVFTAACAVARCRKVIFASSIHAVSGYPPDVQVKTTDPVNPGDLYGVSKCFGEALGRYLSTQEDTSFIALRIGAFEPLEQVRAGGSLADAHGYVSRRDLQQLIEKCLTDRRLQFATFHALSANTFNRLDITDPRELVGYEPQDDFFDVHPRLVPLDLDKSLRDHDQGDGQKSGIRDDIR